VARADCGEDPRPEAAPLAEEVRLEERHPASVELDFPHRGRSRRPARSARRGRSPTRQQRSGAASRTGPRRPGARGAGAPSRAARTGRAAARSWRAVLRSGPTPRHERARECARTDTRTAASTSSSSGAWPAPGARPRATAAAT
jgi:hypothetical protein